MQKTKQKLIEIEPGILAELISENARPEIQRAIEKLNAGENGWARMAYKLSSYREALLELYRDRDQNRALEGERIVAFEVGAGITYLFNYLVLKTLFPQSRIHFIAVDVDAATGRKHSSVFQGDEIQYFVVDAKDARFLAVQAGVEAGTVDCIFVDNPVVCTPEDYARGHDDREQPGSGQQEAMMEMLERSENEAGLRRQYADFAKILEVTLPYFLKPDGLVLSTSLHPNEFPFLQRRFSAGPLDGYRKCLVRPIVC